MDDIVWRVPRPHPVAKIAAAVLFVVLAGLASDPGGVFLAGVAAAGCTVLAVRDLVAPVRLAAGPEGVRVVVGFAGHRTVGWAAVTSIRVDERRRLLARSRLLEIQTDDDLHLFSVHDLGADVDEVADTLAGLRHEAGSR